MLIFYLVALALGGTFVVASLLFGGDADTDLVDVDVDMDIDADVDMDADADVEGDGDGDTEGWGFDGVLAWLPVTSLRFWTFFLAFFGLTGTVLTSFALLEDAWIIAAISGAIGYMSGGSMVAAMRHLSRNQTDSTVSEKDYVGANGIVMVPVSKDRVGKIRIELKGRTVELLAKTEESAPLPTKESVMIYALAGDCVLVTRAA